MGGKTARIYYGYVIVALSFVIGALAWGSQRTFGVFLDPLLKEFGWSRASASLAITIQMFVTGIMSILAGRLSDRFGPRAILTACGIFIGAGYLLLTKLTALGQLYALHGVVIGIGMAGISVPLTSMVIRWFSRQPGLINGVVHAGLGFGITVIPPLATWLIAQYEWRTAYLIIGVMTGILIIAGSQFLKQEPPQAQITTAGNGPPAKAFADSPSLDFRQALRTRAFWLLSLLFFIDIYNINTVMVHIVIHAEDVGLPLALAVSVLSVTAAVSIAGRIAAGALADRVGRKMTVGIGMGLNALAFAWLLLSHGLWAFYLFAVMFGLGGWSVGAVMSPFIAEYFGLKSHGVILGAATFVGTVGGAIGPWVAGQIFDTMKTYNPAFISGASLAGLSIILLVFLKKSEGGQQ